MPEKKTKQRGLTGLCEMKMSMSANYKERMTHFCATINVESPLRDGKMPDHAEETFNVPSEDRYANKQLQQDGVSSGEADTFLNVSICSRNAVI